jgi:hypothetical protein
MHVKLGWALSHLQPSLPPHVFHATCTRSIPIGYCLSLSSLQASLPYSCRIYARALCSAHSKSRTRWSLYNIVSFTAHFPYRNLAKYCTARVRIWLEKYLEIAERSLVLSPQMILSLIVPSGAVFSKATICSHRGPSICILQD